MMGSYQITISVIITASGYGDPLILTAVGRLLLLKSESEPW